jgi:cell shape-determining protein MreD
MTRARVAAAAAGILTALLLQATLIGPVTSPWPVSLPAVLVLAVAFVDGPATGMSFGFAVGLVADLGSSHPAGVLALCWMGMGLIGGLVADRRSLVRDAISAGLLCGVVSSVATLVLLIVHAQDGSALDAVRDLGPAALGDAVLALLLVPLVRRMLHTDSLRVAQPVYTELAIGSRRG